MSKLYNDLVNIIDFEADREEEVRTEKYCKSLQVIANILSSVVIILGIATIFCVYAEMLWVFYVFLIFTIVSLVLFGCYKKKYGVRVNRLINDECNINKALTSYMVIAQYYKRKTKRAGVLLLNISSILCYLGKFEEAKKVLELIRKYCDTPEGNAYRASMYAMIASREKDKEAVAQCVNELEEMISKAGSPYMTTAYNIISKYPMIMEAEENGDYAKALELLEIDEEEASNLKKVNVNYRLYKIAKVAGLEEEAAKHRAYVLEKGGDTIYKKELENIK